MAFSATSRAASTSISGCPPGFTGYIVPNFPDPGGPTDACIVIYGYRPSLALGILGTVLFTVGLAIHAGLVVRHRAWYFAPMAVGTLMEIVGYAFRLLSWGKDPYSIPFYVVQYFFTVVAPVFFSAAIYTVVTLMIDRVGHEYAPVRPAVVLWTFVACDVITTAVQITGSAMVGVAFSNGDDPNPPNHVLTAGLAVQVFSFALFVLCLTSFVWKSRKATSPPFKAFSAAVFVATMAVYLRTCFRLAETAEGPRPYIASHEVFFACLEFLPVVIAVYTLAYWHPARWLGTKTRKGECFRDIPSRPVAPSSI